MVGSNGTMIAIRLVRSKLRKREEQHHHHGQTGCSSVHPEQVQVVGGGGGGGQGRVNQAMSRSGSATSVLDGGHDHGHGHGHGLSIITTNLALDLGTLGNLGPKEQFVWQFPPPYPGPNTPPPSYHTLTYPHHDQDTLVHGQAGFAKGLRKNLGGRWRRLVKRKPESEMCAPLPPELKDQLKTIYVY